MTAFDAEGRPPPPELDRVVDLVGSSHCTQDLNPPYLVFEALHPKQVMADCSGRFFTLPPKVKHLIYSFCLPEEERKITLSPRFATKAVFDDDYFASPWDILDPVWGGLSASQEMRNELLTYFWTEYRFYVSINPFSGPILSPLSHVWLTKYLSIIQYLTIEVDLTRFGGSALRYAPSIGYDCSKLERLIVDLIKGLQKRRNKIVIAELIVLSRKYLGNRPVDGVYVTNADGKSDTNITEGLILTTEQFHGTLKNSPRFVMQCAGFVVNFSDAESLDSLLNIQEDCYTRFSPTEKHVRNFLNQGILRGHLSLFTNRPLERQLLSMHTPWFLSQNMAQKSVQQRAARPTVRTTNLRCSWTRQDSVPILLR